MATSYLASGTSPSEQEGASGGLGSAIFDRITDVTCPAQNNQNYSSGCPGYVTVTWILNPATTTTLASSQNPSAAGQSVTFTATVSAVAPGSGTPSGTVTFSDGGSPIGTGTLSGGQASFSTSALSVFGQQVTFTATVSAVAPGSGTPSGTVTFRDGGSAIRTGTLSGGQATFLDGGSPIGTGTLSGGQASVSTSALAVGDHTITASFSGDGSFIGSTGSLIGNPQVVDGPVVRLEMTASARTLEAGGELTYHLKVRNPNDVALDEVRVCDRLPLGLAFVSSSPESRLSNGSRCWTFKSLGTHKSRTVSLTARALSGAGGKRTNDATATVRGVGRARAHRTVRVRPASKPATPVTG